MASASTDVVTAVLMRIAAGMLTVLMAVLVRLLTPHLPIGEIVFGRSAGALLLIVATLALRRQVRSAFHTHRPFAQLVRGITGTTAMVLNFLALTYLSIAETQSIMYTAPLFTLLISATILGQRVSRARWWAVAIGFGGTALVLSANSISATHNSLCGLGVALAGAALTAAALLQVHHLTRTESTTSIATYFALTAALTSLATLPWGWTWPSSDQLALLLLLGALGALAHLLLTASLVKAEPTILAPFEYLNIVWAIVVGAIIFDERIGVMSLVGAALIIGANFAVIITAWPPADNIVDESSAANPNTT